MKKILFIFLTILLFAMMGMATEIQLVFRTGHHFNSFEWINNFVDREYAKKSNSIKMPFLQPSIEILIGKFSSAHLIGLEFDRNTGSLKKEVVYEFSPMIGIPDLKDIHIRENIVYAFLLNNYFAIHKGEHHRFSLCLGAGLGQYHYKERFDIQLDKNTRSVLKTAKTGIVPAIKISLMSEWRVKKYGVVFLETGVKNGFFVAGGLGITFSIQ